jgi:phosphoribosylamine--glycine ligase
MRVLVLGSGAREHAIVHALRRSQGVNYVFAAPGNPGIAQAADLLPLSANDLPGVAEAAEDLRIDVTIVGPEVPLAMGVCDEFYRRGLRLFGRSSASGTGFLQPRQRSFAPVTKRSRPLVISECRSFSRPTVSQRAKAY